MAEKNNGKFIKISVATILTVIVTLSIFAFGYGINRIDKNTDSIMEIKENYVTKDDIRRLEDKIDKLLENSR